MLKRKLFTTIIQRLEGPEAIVVTGMRRTGKTVLLRQVFDSIESSNKVYLDLENPINRKYFEHENYDAIIADLALFGISPAKRAYVFLDEIQQLPTIPSVVKYLSDHYPIKFFLTGSASFYLKNLFSESLAGRKILYELYPVDFDEFLVLKGQMLIPPVQGGTVSEAVHTRFARLYQEYMEFGGFPGVITKETVQEKRESLEDIFTSYFEKEVLQLSDFRNNTVVRDLILLLFQRVGSRIEYQKLSNELGVSRITIKEYMSFLEQTYLFSLIRPLSGSRDREIRGTPKIYCIDSGLVNHFGKVDAGSLIENAIFHQLRAGSRMIHYYRRKNGSEIDFIVDQKKAYEVKRKATPRDLQTLRRLAGDLTIKDSALISYLYTPNLDVTYGFQL